MGGTMAAPQLPRPADDWPSRHQQTRGMHSRARRQPSADEAASSAGAAPAGQKPAARVPPGLVGLETFEELLRAYTALTEAKAHLLEAWQLARWDEARAALLLLAREADGVQSHAAVLLKLLFSVDPAASLDVPPPRPALPPTSTE